MVSKQQENILDIIRDLGEATPSDIATTYKKRHGNEIGNIYTQLNRLLDKRLIDRINDSYELSDKGTKIYEDSGEIEEIKDEMVTQEDKEKILNFSDRELDKVLEDLSDRAYPEILGVRDAKISCLASAVSMPDRGASRNRVTVLLYGKKGTAKSSLVKQTSKLVGGRTVQKSGSKEGGLRGTAKGREFTKGALQKADRSLLGIDEVSKYGTKEQEALLNAIDEGKVRINLDQVDKPTDTRVRVVASANNIDKIIEPLRDRFDVQIELQELDEVTKKKLLVRKCQNWNRNTVVDVGFIKKYLKYASNFETKLPSNRGKLIDIILEEIDNLENLSVRHIESIFRLSLALSRLHLENTVQEEHIRKAVDLAQV